MAYKSFCGQALLVVFLVLLEAQNSMAQDQIEMDCVPTIKHRYDVCPPTYCCVRDEFLPTYVYCKKIGSLDDNCTTNETESECPCGPGLYCRANIQGQFPSVYGKCAVDNNATARPSTSLIG